MWTIPKHERRLCPPEYHSRLRDIAGMNRFGGNNFRIVWGQTEREIVGGTWQMPTGKTKLRLKPDGQLGLLPEVYEIAEMRYILKYDGKPCWFLERWFPPENYGTEFQWFRENTDPKSGLPLLGPYPDAGYYECCMPLTRSTGEAIELNDYVIDALVPLILRTHETTEWERRAARNALREKQAQADHDRRVQLYIDKVPVGGPISYAGQINRTSRVARVNLGSKLLRGLPKKFGQIN